MYADLVELKDGSWYAVLLGSRLIDGNHKNLGRETFICPVIWEREWPLFSPETGKIENEYEMPKSLAPVVYEKVREREEFDEEKLPMYMVFWGTPRGDFWKLENSKLKLKCIRQRLDDELKPMKMDGNLKYDRYTSFVGRRQCAVNAMVTAQIKFVAENSESAGIAAVQAMNHQLHVERVAENGKQLLRAVVTTAEYDRPPYFPGFEGHTERQILAVAPWEPEEVILQIEMRGEDFTVRYGAKEGSLNELCKLDGSVINPEKVGCMCGTLLGMYATGNGEDSENSAEFDWFAYREF